MRFVIVDDEPLARERLRSLLAAQDGVDVVAEAGNGEQALNAQPVVAAGGGLLVDDAAFTPELVRETVVPLAGDAERLAAMSAAAGGTGHRDAAGTVAAAALALAQERRTR